MFGPIVELIGFTYFFAILALGNLDSTFVLLFFTVAVMLGMVLSVSAVLCEEFTYRRYPSIKDVATLTLFAFIENIGYRQIHTWWRFKGLIDFFKGKKEWGEMNRTGFSEEEDESEDNKEERAAKEKQVQEGESYTLLKKLKPLRYWSVIALITFLLGYLVVQVLAAHRLLPDLVGLWNQMIS